MLRRPADSRRTSKRKHHPCSPTRTKTPALLSNHTGRTSCPPQHHRRLQHTKIRMGKRWMPDGDAVQTVRAASPCGQLLIEQCVTGLAARAHNDVRCPRRLQLCLRTRHVISASCPTPSTPAPHSPPGTCCPCHTLLAFEAPFLALLLKNTHELSCCCHPLPPACYKAGHSCFPWHGCTTAHLPHWKGGPQSSMLQV